MKAVDSVHAAKLVDPAAEFEVPRFETSGGKHLLQVLDRTMSTRLSGRRKKKMQREGVFREMKRRRFYEEPSEKMAREKSEQSAERVSGRNVSA